LKLLVAFVAIKSEYIYSLAIEEFYLFCLR
jgi:hypothetical protein